MAQPAFVLPDTTTPDDDYSRYRLIDLYKEVHGLMTQRHALEYRLSLCLRELDQRDGLDGRRLPLASWFARQFGVGYGAAREKVRTARSLRSLPLIDAAFREGKLSYSKVRALTRVANSHNEEDLLNAAARASTDGVERLVRLAKQRERMDDVQAMLKARSLTFAWDDDGSLVIRARLTPEQGAIWIKAFEKAESDQRAGGDSSGDSIDDSLDAGGFAARRADVMTDALAETLRKPSERKATCSGDRYQVVVHVSAETLSTNVSAETFSGSGVGTIERGPHLHPETVRRLTCDGALVSVLEDGQGKVLNVGRKTRVIPTAIRRALKVRDGGCQYPGCSQSRYVDGHHITHWADGGETKLDNLVLICGRHHRLVHEFGYRISKTETGFEFVKPAGLAQ